MIVEIKAEENAFADRLTGMTVFEFDAATAPGPYVPNGVLQEGGPDALASARVVNGPGADVCGA